MRVSGSPWDGTGSGLPCAPPQALVSPPAAVLYCTVRGSRPLRHFGSNHCTTYFMCSCLPCSLSNYFFLYYIIVQTYFFFVFLTASLWPASCSSVSWLSPVFVFYPPPPSVSLYLLPRVFLFGRRRQPDTGVLDEVCLQTSASVF